MSDQTYFEHSDQLVLYINRCHTYPTSESRSLALWIADRYFPTLGGAVVSYADVQEAFSASRAAVARWFKDMRSTGYWESHTDLSSKTTLHSLSDDAMADLEEWLHIRRSTGKKPGVKTVVSRNS